MASDAVARAGYRALQRGRPVAIPGLRHRLLALAVRLLPRRMVVEAVRRIQEKRA
jgi:short-subunit dehydrogenase